MSIIAPEVMGKDEILLKEHSRHIIRRRFWYLHGLEEWMLWGGKPGSKPVIIFPVTKHGLVVAVNQFRHAPTPPRFIIELPGGNSEKLEESVDTARQELAQETGYTAQAFVKLGDEHWFDPASCFTPHASFLATGCEKVGEPKLDKTEVLEVVTFTIVEWMRMIYDCTVRDDKTLAVTMLALPHLGYRLVKD